MATAAYAHPRMGKIAAPLAAAMILVACASSAQHFAAEDGLRALEGARLEVVDGHPMTAADFGLAPQLASSAIRFQIPSLGSGKGGRIMAFRNTADLDRTRAYYENLGKASPTLFSWTYTHENLLLQINGQLPADIAAKYGAALNNV